MATQNMEQPWGESDTFGAPSRERNVSEPERVMSAVAGGGMLVYGLRRRSWDGFAMAVAGGSLLYRAATGHCPVYASLGVSTSRSSDTKEALGGSGGVHVYERITINRPVSEVYRFWRQLENLPRFMAHLESVTPLGGGRSRWVAKAPVGLLVTWDAEIINEVENEVIAWRSLEGSDVTSAGSVNFQPVANGTEVRVNMQYDPPASKVGAALAKLFGEEPSQQIAEDLGRLKEILESRDAQAVGAGFRGSADRAH